MSEEISRGRSFQFLRNRVRAAGASNRRAALRSPPLFEVLARGFQIDRSTEQSEATENQDGHGVAL